MLSRALPAALLLTVAPSIAFVETRAAAQPVRPLDVRVTYLRDCAVCHGSSGEGTPRGPRIAGAGRALVDYAVSTGRMPIADPRQKVTRHRPAYPRPLVDALVNYVAGFAPGGPDIPVVEVHRGQLPRGGELYRLQCAACHAWAGDGGALLHREAPSLHNATPTQIAEAIRTGPGRMPAFGTAAISDAELTDVVAYVRYLDRPRDRGGWPLWHLGPMAEGGAAWVLGIGALLLAVAWMGERINRGDSHG